MIIQERTEEISKKNIKLREMLTSINAGRISDNVIEEVLAVEEEEEEEEEEEIHEEREEAKDVEAEKSNQGEEDIEADDFSIWLDIIAINQHSSFLIDQLNMSIRRLKIAFHVLLKSIGDVAVILGISEHVHADDDISSPDSSNGLVAFQLSQPPVFTRTFCIFEMNIAISVCIVFYLF